MCTTLGLTLGEGWGGPSDVILIGGVALGAALWGPRLSASPMGIRSCGALLHARMRPGALSLVARVGVVLFLLSDGVFDS